MSVKRGLPVEVSFGKTDLSVVQGPSRGGLWSVSVPLESQRILHHPRSSIKGCTQTQLLHLNRQWHCQRFSYKRKLFRDKRTDCVASPEPYRTCAYILQVWGVCEKWQPEETLQSRAESILRSVLPWCRSCRHTFLWECKARAQWQKYIHFSLTHDQGWSLKMYSQTVLLWRQRV